MPNINTVEIEYNILLVKIPVRVRFVKLATGKYKCNKDNEHFSMEEIQEYLKGLRTSLQNGAISGLVVNTR